MNRFTLRHAVTGQPIYRKWYAALDEAERAARRVSWRTDGCTVEVWLEGKADVCLAYAWHGAMHRLADIPSI